MHGVYFEIDKARYIHTMLVVIQQLLTLNRGLRERRVSDLYLSLDVDVRRGRWAHPWFDDV